MQRTTDWRRTKVPEVKLFSWNKFSRLSIEENKFRQPDPKLPNNFILFFFRRTLLDTKYPQSTSKMNSMTYLSPCRVLSPTAADTRINKQGGMGEPGLQIGARPRDVSSLSTDKSPNMVKDHAHGLSNLQRSLRLQNSFMSAAFSVSSLDSCSYDPLEDEEEADDASLTAHQGEASSSTAFQEIMKAEAQQQQQHVLLSLNSISLSMSRFDSMPNLVDFQEDAEEEKEQEEQQVLGDNDQSDFTSFRNLQKLKKRESRWQSTSTTMDTKQDFMPNTPRRQNRRPHINKGVISSSPVCVSSFREYGALSMSPLCDAAPLPPRRTSPTDEQRITRAASCNGTITVRQTPLLPATPRQTRRASWDTLPTPPRRRTEELVLVELEDSNH